MKEPAEKVIQNIRRATRSRYSAEEKITVMLDGLRGKDSIAELCWREDIPQNLYYLDGMIAIRRVAWMPWKIGARVRPGVEPDPGRGSAADPAVGFG